MGRWQSNQHDNVRAGQFSVPNPRDSIARQSLSASRKGRDHFRVAHTQERAVSHLPLGKGIVYGTYVSYVGRYVLLSLDGGPSSLYSGLAQYCHCVRVEGSCPFLTVDEWTTNGDPCTASRRGPRACPSSHRVTSPISSQPLSHATICPIPLLITVFVDPTRKSAIKIALHEPEAVPRVAGQHHHSRAPANYIRPHHVDIHRIVAQRSASHPPIFLNLPVPPSISHRHGRTHSHRYDDALGRPLGRCVCRRLGCGYSAVTATHGRRRAREVH